MNSLWTPVIPEPDHATAGTNHRPRIGNIPGTDTTKFEAFGLTAVDGVEVSAPLIAECHASFECRLQDEAMAERYDFFVFEVVKAHVAPVPEHPETLHYLGDARFMTAGPVVERRSQFTRGVRSFGEWAAVIDPA